MSYKDYSQSSREAKDFLAKAQHRNKNGNIYFYNNYICYVYDDIVRIEERKIGHDGPDFSFNGEIKNEMISIATGIGDIIVTRMGDISDAYTMLKSKIKNINIDNINEVMEAIIMTIDDYFGGYSNLSERLKYYNPDNPEENKISNLKGKGVAMCSERAALAQNLLSSIGINVTYNTSFISINGTREYHAYNLIELNGRYYLFDSCYPKGKDGHINPLIGEISKEAFELITHPESSVGYSIYTEHYCPYLKSSIKIEYDPGREKKEKVLDNSLNNYNKSL